MTDVTNAAFTAQAEDEKAAACTAPVADVILLTGATGFLGTELADEECGSVSKKRSTSR